MTDQNNIAPRRIGSGGGYFIFGGLALAIGILFSFGGLYTLAPAGFFSAIGAGLIAVYAIIAMAFWWG